MLYYLLYRILDVNIFKYVTFRAMSAFLFSFAFVLVFEPLFIKWLRNYGVKGQPIRSDGPKQHEVKQGTPTMGGFVIIAGMALATVLFTDLDNRYVWLSLGVMLGNAGIGFYDDWLKITKQNPKGVSGKTKLRGQCWIAFLAALLLYFSDFSTTLNFPFFKELIVPLSVLFVPFAMLVVVGASNAVNLTDGLDGLAIVPVMTVSLTYAAFAYLADNQGFARYLGIPHVLGASELAIILAATAGAGLGFLWYNTYPAQVFMGDVGALSLGGTLGFIAVVVKQELVLVLAGGIFVVEAISVIIQVYSFKMTGKRVFKMAPIHHHFELLGLSEPKIIVRFWIVSILLALLSLTTLKLR